MKKVLALILIFSSYIFANEQRYTIAVCATSTLEYALTCKKRIYDNSRGEVFIVKQNNIYYTNLNVYDNKQIARMDLKKSSKYVLDQKPYVKDIDKSITDKIDRKKLVIDLDESVKIEEKPTTNEIKSSKEEDSSQITYTIPVVSSAPQRLQIVSPIPFNVAKEEKEQEKQEEQKQATVEYELKSQIDFGNMYENKEISTQDADDLLQISMQEFDNQIATKQKISSSYQKTQTAPKKIEQPLGLNKKELVNYDGLVIKVDSKTNIMNLYAKVKNEEKMLKSYIVSTGKNSIQKPLGEGGITQISLNPTWYPTEDTKRSFAKKGIYLPNVVPPNHKYNYMGLAKLNLTHSVNGNTTYRIHGTLNEKTLGSNESAGCIRMKNNDVLELAKFIEEFANIKSLSKVRVILL